MTIEPFLEALTTWAAARRDVVGLALVGSQARGSARPDSDVDVVILAANPARLLRGGWSATFGAVESSRIEDYGALQSLRVFYRHGLEVEFGIAKPDWARLPLDAGTRKVLADGVRVLYDAEGLLEKAHSEA